MATLLRAKRQLDPPVVLPTLAGPPPAPTLGISEEAAGRVRHAGPTPPNSTAPCYCLMLRLLFLAVCAVTLMQPLLLLLLLLLAGVPVRVCCIADADTSGGGSSQH